MLNENARFTWERSALMELRREHEYICWLHKVNLKPVGIEFFDSETRWGEYNPSTRTIYISRKLIMEHPWEHVSGVFRHEMAHQYVDEYIKEQSQPHGEFFKAACQRLGVPFQYSKAGLSFTSSTLDWRRDPLNSEKLKILERAQKLLSLANSTNEHEAQLAMDRVRDLYAKHNLDPSQTASTPQFYHLVITHGKKRRTAWEQRIATILPEHFFVQTITYQQFDVQKQHRVQALELIGTYENVLMAEYVYHFLLQQIENLLMKQIRQGSRMNVRDCTSYRLGVLEGFCIKLKQSELAKSSETSPNPAPSVIGTALTQFKNDKFLKDHLKTIYPKISWGRSSSRTVNADAFSAGRADGKQINLHKPISNNMGNRGHLLQSSN